MLVYPLTIDGERYPGRVVTFDMIHEETWKNFPRDIRKWVNRNIDRYKQGEYVEFPWLSTEEPFQLIAQSLKGIAVEFSKIKTNADIEQFTSKYGLLCIDMFNAVREDFNWYMHPWIEEVTTWRKHIAEVRGLLQIYNDINKKDSEPLYEYKIVQGKERMFLYDCLVWPAEEEYGPREMAARVLARMLSRKLGNIRVDYSEIVADNTASIGIRVVQKYKTNKLITAIYYDLWSMVATEEVIKLCDFCTEVIESKHGKRKYCSDRCRQAAHRRPK